MKKALGITCLALLLVWIVISASRRKPFPPEQQAEEKAAQDKRDAARKTAVEKQKKEAQEKIEADANRNQKNAHKLAELLTRANKDAGANFFKRADVDGNEATITVNNAWHSAAYQVRLQTAQSLWKAWAVMAAPDDIDKARISIVDLNKNEVGGSRALGGSLIWVRD